MIQVMVIRSNGKWETREHQEEPQLEDLQALVGGYIEMVPMRFKFAGKPAVMYVNEDGLQKKLPPNEAASSLCGGFYTIVGTAVLVQISEGAADLLKRRTEGGAT
jgi:uncharacterized protein DUF3846